MTPVPTRFAAVILCFAEVSGQRTWRWAEPLLMGAILVPGRRTVASVLRVLGLSGERHFVNYHRVLSRAAWSPRAAARVLLRLLINAFVPHGPVGPWHRRHDRAPPRCAHCGQGHLPRPRALLAQPFRQSQRPALVEPDAAGADPMGTPRVGATCTDGLGVVRAPQPRAGPSPQAADRLGAPDAVATAPLAAGAQPLVVVADSSFAALDLLGSLAPHMTCITRLRLDAQLYAPAPPRTSGTPGRPRKKGAGLPALSEVLVDATTRWHRLVVPRWYAQTAREIEVVSGTDRVVSRGAAGAAHSLGAHP